SYCQSFCFSSVLFTAGASDTTRVDQTPPFIIKRTGQSVDSEINCAHSITDYQQILWYKQDKHKLKFLGYLNLDNPNTEDDVKGKISFKGDGRKHSNFTISNVSLNDSGVYFCAASYHSAADSPQVNTKTFQSIPNPRHTRLSGP
uniref:Ig-like domain-containing protein n=1 Tax=Seriola lalandi dorsalis TaxID=1841481 RepID=A0A3B4X6U4_SERLL